MDRPGCRSVAALPTRLGSATFDGAAVSVRNDRAERTGPRPSAARRPRGRRALAAGVALLAFATVSLAGIPSAGAHAVLTSSTPRDGERLAAAPADVVMRFSEHFTSDVGGLTVLDASGARVDNGDSAQPDPSTLRVTLRPGLPEGTYVANYRILSAEGHAISGAIVFGVGGATLTDVSSLAQQNSPALEAGAAVARFVVYVAALLAGGLAFFAGFIHDGRSDRRRLARPLRIATSVAAVAVITVVAVQAALAGGQGFASVVDGATLRSVLRQGIGWQTAVLLAGLASCHVSLHGAKRTVLSQALGFYGAIAVTASFVLWGHAVESPRSALAIPADIVHVAAAALWFGGLVGLTIVLRARSRDTGAAEPTPEVGEAARPASAALLRSTVVVVQRFSTAAAVSLLLLVGAGGALSFSEVGGAAALTSTTYGKTLLAKLAVVAVILVVAGFNRWRLLPWVLEGAEEISDAAPAGDVGAAKTAGEAGEADGADRAGSADGAEPDAATIWKPLVNTVRVEAAGIVAVLAITAVLVNVTPAITVPTASEPLQQSQPFTATATSATGTTGAGGVRVELTVTPNRPGSNSLHVSFLDAAGRIADPVQRLDIELRLPDKGIGPISRQARKAGRGHFILENTNDLALPGTWEITLVSRVSDSEQVRTTFTDTIA